MRNIKLTVAYDGTNYVGWQIQPNGVSIQDVVQRALSQLTGEDIRLLAAGRTDSGVHALGQVANFKTDCTIPTNRFPAALQSRLPRDIVIREAREVSDDFHATYSAVRKRYRYVIHNSRTSSPFLRNYVHQLHHPLDADAMHDAAQELLGKHDFRCFESHFPNKATSVRTVMEVTVQRHAGWPMWNDATVRDATVRDATVRDATVRDATVQSNAHNGDGEFLWLEIVADGFLYNMVRAITGTLLRVGDKRWTRDDIRRIIVGMDRSQAGETAPPQGLYLVHVDYDE